MTDHILRGPAVRQKLGGISYDTLRRMVKRGDFPAPVVITAGQNGVHGWRESDVDAWIASRPAFGLPTEEPAGAEAGR